MRNKQCFAVSRPVSIKHVYVYLSSFSISYYEKCTNLMDELMMMNE